MKHRNCEICGLRTAKTEYTKRYFKARFPHDEARCKLWVKMTGKEDLVYVSIEKLHEMPSLRLLYLGREWPQGYDLFRKRLHKVFSRNSEESDPEKIKTMIKHGEFVVKEIEALYKLKKYRAMKRRYYDDS